MNINTVFPSKYLSAAEIEDKVVNVTIDRCEMEQMQDGKSVPVLYFRDKSKGMVLNKTNAGTLAMVYGDETNNWPGQPLSIFTADTSYQGKMCKGLRVRIPQRNGQPAAEPEQQPDYVPPEGAGGNDDIPF